MKLYNFWYNLWDSFDETFLLIERGGDDDPNLQWVEELTSGCRFFLGDDDIKKLGAIHSLYVYGKYTEPEIASLPIVVEMDNMTRNIYNFVKLTTNWRDIWFFPIVRGNNNRVMDFTNGFQV